MRDGKGFTLIELLVVIAIIAILAAILFPVFLAAKGKAQQSACMANMKELGSALYTYLADWQDTYPANRFQDPLMPTNSQMNGTRYNWKTALQTCMRTKGDVWRCAANRNSRAFDETGTAVIGQVGEVPRYPIGYSYNGEFFNQLDASYRVKAMRVSNIKRTTRLLVVVESVMAEPDIHADFATEQWALYPDYTANPPRNVKGCRVLIHQGAVTNCLFADTHAKAMKLRDTLVPQSMWYPGNQSKYDDIASKLALEAQ